MTKGFLNDIPILATKQKKHIPPPKKPLKVQPIRHLPLQAPLPLVEGGVKDAPTSHEDGGARDQRIRLILLLFRMLLSHKISRTLFGTPISPMTPSSGGGGERTLRSLLPSPDP